MLPFHLEVVDRLLRYVQIDTRSVPRIPGVKEIHPSSPGQRIFADQLIAELLEIGVPKEWITQLKDASALIQFPATHGYENTPHVCYVAHVDTSPSYPGAAKPIIHNYTSGDIVLPNGGVVIPAADLKGLEGKTIITTDGTTLLGGDDKAGVAAIMTFIKHILTNHVPHGPISVWFCTDEEIGELGVKFLPPGVAEKWDILLTVDGKNVDLVTTSCFFGISIEVTFTGNDAHPGEYGKDLKAAHYAACRLVDKLGDGPTPMSMKTRRDPFLYVAELPTGSAGKSIVSVNLRTFNRKEIRGLRALVKKAAEEAANKYKVGVKVKRMKIEYSSTEVAITNNQELCQPIFDALKELGIDPKLYSVRGGTDGAMWNRKFPHIPAPDIGTGARNLHSLREFVVVDELLLIPWILLNICQRFAKMIRKPRH